MKEKKIYGKPGKHYCKRCGNTFLSPNVTATKFCKSCTDLLVESKSKKGYYQTANGKTIFLHNGLEVLNNVMGKEISNRIL